MWGQMQPAQLWGGHNSSDMFGPKLKVHYWVFTCIVRGMGGELAKLVELKCGSKPEYVGASASKLFMHEVP